MIAPLEDPGQLVAVFAVRLALVVTGYLSLEAYLDRRPLATAGRAGLCALFAIWVDRQVLGQSDDAAAAGSILGIVTGNYLMTRRRKGARDE
jgi:hypothetical protein